MVPVMEAKASRRELTKAHNRETILAAARQVFAEMGFATATVRDIIRATPLASGTFYNYFKSKEEVYQALRDEQALKLRPRLREARLAAASADAFFTSSFHAFFAFVAESQEGRPRTAPEPFRMDSPEVLAGFAELKEDITAAMARGLIPAADAASLAAAVAGVAFELGGRVKTGADVDEMTRFATQLFLGGVPALPHN